MVSHLEQMDGLAVRDWHAGELLSADFAPRLALDWNSKTTWLELFEALLQTPNADKLRGLVVGMWDEESSENSSHIVNAIIAARAQLPDVRALFVGDLESEENEISWIQQSNLAPLLDAFPALEWFGARGGSGLELDSPAHQNLKTLIIEAGGLDGALVRGLAQADLPELEHLELYLGTENYGATATIEDLQPILDGTVFPKLKVLGLRNAEIADEIAGALNGAAILDRIEVLDLSLGTLSDDGAAALLENPALANLSALDLHYHFLSDAMQEKLKALPCEVDLTEAQSGDEWDGEVHRYVAVSE